MYLRLGVSDGFSKLATVGVSSAKLAFRASMAWARLFSLSSSEITHTVPPSWREVKICSSGQRSTVTGAWGSLLTDVFDASVKGIIAILHSARIWSNAKDRSV